MTKEQLLAEVEDVLRNMPSMETILDRNQENLSWFGRAAAVIEQWNLVHGTLFGGYINQLRRASSLVEIHDPFSAVTTMLYQARHALRMQTIGPMSVAIPHGSVFDYFDEIRKIIEVARQDLLFVDPYLDAEFVSRYLGHAAQGVTIRLLAREKLQTLLPAVDVFAKQSQAKIEVRSASSFHDRFIFIDKKACYQSGASFKDGARSAPTTLTQITDAFAAVLQTYEDRWNQGKVER
jgi:hypothetical protein